MSWVEQHPYLAGLIAACIVIVVGGFVVVMRSPISSGNAENGTWAGGVSTLDPSSYAPAQSQPSIVEQVKTYAPYSYIPPTQVQQGGGASDTQGDSGAFDFSAFAAQLSQSSGSATKSGASTSGSNLSSAYAYIPSGLISTQTTLDTTRSTAQQALYEYGNEAGSFIQSFEASRPDMAQMLKNQMVDRTDPQKIAAVVALANDLSALGDSLSNMDTVPPAVQSAHSALVKSYHDLGQKLPAVANAKSNQDLITAINTYDAAAIVFTNHYVALAQILAASGVTFGPEDPGSVFTFSPKSL